MGKHHSDETMETMDISSRFQNPWNTLTGELLLLLFFFFVIQPSHSGLTSDSVSRGLTVKEISRQNNPRTMASLQTDKSER